MVLKFVFGLALIFVEFNIEFKSKSNQTRTFWSPNRPTLLGSRQVSMRYTVAQAQTNSNTHTVQLKPLNPLNSIQAFFRSQFSPSPPSHPVMASACRQFANRASVSSIRSAIRSNAPKSPTSRFPLPTSAPSSAPVRGFSISRSLSLFDFFLGFYFFELQVWIFKVFWVLMVHVYYDLGQVYRCTGMRPITTATPQRGGCGEADVSTEHNIEELPSALTGYSLPHLSQPLNFAFF